MEAVKKLAMIFLALYLLISGLMGLTEAVPSDGMLFFVKGCGVVAGILLLVSIETFCGSSCERD